MENLRFLFCLKFKYSEKPTKFCKIFTLLLTVCTVANFTLLQIIKCFYFLFQLLLGQKNVKKSMALLRKKIFRRPCVVPRDKDVIFRMRASLLYRPAKALCSKSKLVSYFCLDLNLRELKS